ncbi:hypothetical protein [Rhodothermus marinus]|uniref:hypothetical protein n=1 Tax=Rhodothermus marinus TaxID=29549 RepID=UPI000A6BD7ED|nr:hypothetical protein [Rhodothermus marinus]
MLTIGDELLAGTTVNTNAAWLGAELTARGVAWCVSRRSATIRRPSAGPSVGHVPRPKW